MAIPLRLLLIEDSEEDTQTLIRELHKGGYDTTYTRVSTGAELEMALARGKWDIAIAEQNRRSTPDSKATIFSKKTVTTSPLSWSLSQYP